MKLRRLYSNQPTVFRPIEFNDGVSAVLAEIRLPENRDLDTHNLGKTTVGELIDFCLLKGKDPDFFLFKHPSRFSDFAFYLELHLDDGTFLTIRRRVDPGSRVEFKRSEESISDAGRLSKDEWDHYDLPFERSQSLLNGILGFDVLKPWKFRKLVGYLIRSQRDYLDVFQLGKFSGKHQEWKPFVAHLLGMQAQLVIDLYEKRAQLEETTTSLRTLAQEWGGDDVDPSLLDGLISVKRRDVSAKQAALDAFSFRDEDQRTISELVERVEYRIVALNDEAYRLAQLIRRIDESLEDRKIVFDPEEAAQLFRDAGVLFEGQLRKGFDQLIAFNRAITEERRVALTRQREEAKRRTVEIQTELQGLNAERTQSLGYLRQSDALRKYKEVSRELADLQGELSTLEAKRTAASRLIELRRKRRSLDEEYGHLQTEVEDELARISQDEESRFGHIRRFFSEIIFEVLGEPAVLAITMNNAGGLEFHAEFIGASGTATSGDRGTSYKKLLCIAFDLAMLRAYSDDPFSRFVYLDGALEQLEPRKREKLIGVFRTYASLGLQPILSLLDSDLPEPLDAGTTTLSSVDVVLKLHDEGQEGRLFRMPSW